MLQAIYQVGRPQTEAGLEEKSIILRFHAKDMGSVVSALEAAGFPIAEMNDDTGIRGLSEDVVMSEPAYELRGCLQGRYWRRVACHLWREAVRSRGAGGA